eukprot:3662422-Rhodomonas_salina.1
MKAWRTSGGVGRMAARRHRWAQNVTKVRQKAEYRFRVLALMAPGVRGRANLAARVETVACGEA